MIRGQITGQHAHSSGFTGPIRAQEADYFTLVDTETDIIDSGFAAKIAGKL
jgi:hypothetical protein